MTLPEPASRANVDKQRTTWLDGDIPQEVRTYFDSSTKTENILRYFQRGAIVLHMTHLTESWGVLVTAQTEPDYSYSSVR